MDLGLGWQPESLDNPTHTHTIALGVTEAWAMSTYLLSKHSSLLGCIPRQASKHLNEHFILYLYVPYILNIWNFKLACTLVIMDCDYEF